MDINKIERMRDVFCSMRQALACLECKRVCVDPWTIKCGHSFCKQCIEKLWLTERNCPRCLFFAVTRSSQKKNNQLEKVISKFKILEDSFKKDSQINISKDLFQKSFEVDHEIQRKLENDSSRNSESVGMGPSSSKLDTPLKHETVSSSRKPENGTPKIQVRRTSTPESEYFQRWKNKSSKRKRFLSDKSPSKAKEPTCVLIGDEGEKTSYSSENTEKDTPTIQVKRISTPDSEYFQRMRKAFSKRLRVVSDGTPYKDKEPSSELTGREGKEADEGGQNESFAEMRRQNRSLSGVQEDLDEEELEEEQQEEDDDIFQDQNMDRVESSGKHEDEQRMSKNQSFGKGLGDLNQRELEGKEQDEEKNQTDDFQNQSIDGNEFSEEKGDEGGEQGDEKNQNEDTQNPSLDGLGSHQDIDEDLGGEQQEKNQEKDLQNQSFDGIKSREKNKDEQKEYQDRSPDRVEFQKDLDEEKLEDHQDDEMNRKEDAQDQSSNEFESNEEIERKQYQNPSFGEVGNHENSEEEESGEEQEEEENNRQENFQNRNFDKIKSSEENEDERKLYQNQSPDRVEFRKDSDEKELEDQQDDEMNRKEDSQDQSSDGFEPSAEIERKQYQHQSFVGVRIHEDFDEEESDIERQEEENSSQDDFQDQSSNIIKSSEKNEEEQGQYQNQSPDRVELRKDFYEGQQEKEKNSSYESESNSNIYEKDEKKYQVEEKGDPSEEKEETKKIFNVLKESLGLSRSSSLGIGRNKLPSHGSTSQPSTRKTDKPVDERVETIPEFDFVTLRDSLRKKTKKSQTPEAVSDIIPTIASNPTSRKKNVPFFYLGKLHRGFNPMDENDSMRKNMEPVDEELVAEKTCDEIDNTENLSVQIVEKVQAFKSYEVSRPNLTEKGLNKLPELNHFTNSRSQSIISETATVILDSKKLEQMKISQIQGVSMSEMTTEILDMGSYRKELKGNQDQAAREEDEMKESHPTSGTDLLQVEKDVQNSNSSKQNEAVMNPEVEKSHMWKIKTLDQVRKIKSLQYLDTVNENKDPKSHYSRKKEYFSSNFESMSEKFNGKKLDQDFEKSDFEKPRQKEIEDQILKKEMGRIESHSASSSDMLQDESHIQNIDSSKENRNEINPRVKRLYPLPRRLKTLPPVKRNESLQYLGRFDQSENPESNSSKEKRSLNSDSKMPDEKQLEQDLKKYEKSKQRDTEDQGARKKADNIESHPTSSLNFLKVPGPLKLENEKEKRFLAPLASKTQYLSQGFVGRIEHPAQAAKERMRVSTENSDEICQTFHIEGIASKGSQSQGDWISEDLDKSADAIAEERLDIDEIEDPIFDEIKRRDEEESVILLESVPKILKKEIEIIHLSDNGDE